MGPFRSLLLLLPIAAAALIAAACTKTVESPASASQSFPEQLQVTGEGRVTAAPDLAVLDLGVSVLRESVAAAQSDGAALMARVLDALRANGISDADVTTTYFSVYPEYDYSREGPPALRGYRVSNNVSVRLHEIDAVGKVFDDVATAGGDEIIISGVSFTVDDPTPLIDQARTLAAQDAQRRAGALADLSGVKIGKIASVTESAPAGGPQAFPFGKFAGAGGVPISEGQIEVVVSLFVSYEIER